MKKLVSIILACLMIMSVAVAFTSCGGSSSKTYKLATGGTTGTYYAFGGAIASIVSNNSDVKLSAISSGASKANILDLVAGDADFAIVQNDVAFYAYTGTDLFSANGKKDSFRTIGYMYSEVCQIVATSDIKSIEDLKGKRVSVGDQGSGVEFNAKQILAAYGITFDDISKQNLSFGDSADAVKDGTLDAFFCTAGAPTTAITDLAINKSIHILSIDDEHIAKLQSEYDFYKPYTIAADTYKGVAEAKTVAVKATLICRADIDENTVYTIVKTLFDKASTDNHAKFSEFTFADMFSGCETSTVPFHAGALRYYNENK